MHRFRSKKTKFCSKISLSSPSVMSIRLLSFSSVSVWISLTSFRQPWLELGFQPWFGLGPLLSWSYKSIYHQYNNVIVYISQIHHHVNHTEKGFESPDSTWLCVWSSRSYLFCWSNAIFLMLCDYAHAHDVDNMPEVTWSYCSSLKSW